MLDFPTFIRLSPACLSIALLVLASGTPLAAQGITFQAPGVHLQLDGYLQVQFNTSSVTADDVPSPPEVVAPASSTFETRRARIYLTANFDDWIEARIQPDFALGQLKLGDAFIDFVFDPRLGLRVGQFKQPFNLMGLRSSTQIPVIERGLRIRGLDTEFRSRLDSATPGIDGQPLVGDEQLLLALLGYVGRDLGAALHGRLGRFAYEVAVMNGNGSDRLDDSNAKSYAARLELTPIAGAPLHLGAALSRRDALPDAATEPSESLHGTLWEADAEWGAFRREGPYALAEAQTGHNLLTGGVVRAGQALVAWFHGLPPGRVQGVEATARASWADPDADRPNDEGLLLTPGLNLYFAGRNRLMLDLDWFRPSDPRLEPERSLRAQAQVYF